MIIGNDKFIFTASDLHGYDLITDNCDINASGGSDVNITCHKELNVNADGRSDVHYKGNGLIKNVNNGGSAKRKKSKVRKFINLLL